MNISIIIPTFNESSGISQLITHLNQASNSDIVSEIIVVDGQSSDDTCSIAAQCGAKILSSPEKGRAKQMNYAAEHAKSDILHFLHADSYPPDNFDKEIINAVSEGFPSGCFRMKFDSGHLLLKFFQWFTRFGNNFCRGGDQSLFITKKLFNDVGGFPEIPLMEDIEIIRKIKKKAKFKVIPKELVTSARRYREKGHFRLQFWFSLIHFYYWIGASPNYLHRFYQKHVL